MTTSDSTHPPRDTDEVLRHEGEFVLVREHRDGGLPPMLSLVAERVSEAGLRALQHEYSLRGLIDPAWAARPHSLTHAQGVAVLKLDDPGGELLSRTTGRPWSTAAFLPLAVSVAAALDGVHRAAIIHKDVKPANILADVATGRAWLTGFGIAARSACGERPLDPPPALAGTLAYMAPEQTGRMNRSLDSRADLYAYGVTLYELLTGVLPFQADTPIEWVHCHLAKQPSPPRERVGEIPEMLSAIVMKLLAKAPEDRYQTARGVEADLRRCLEDSRASGGVKVFPLGEADTPDRLVIPQKLYGRAAECSVLAAALTRVAREGATEMVLVAGPPGVGKSSLVNELRASLAPFRSLFAIGKCDQYQRDAPYAVLAQALRGVVRSMLSLSNGEVARWRSEIATALGSNGQLIVDLIPEVELIVGPQPPVQMLGAQDAKSRFQTVFRRLVAALATVQHPLVVFLDDLQWLDVASRELLEHLVPHHELHHLLLIGAYRDNDPHAAELLEATVRRVAAAGARTTSMRLEPLGVGPLERLLSDALGANAEHVRPLAELMKEKTGGNPFFAVQFAVSLADQRLLTFEPLRRAWRWDLERLRMMKFADNVGDLMVGRLGHLSPAAREALSALACVGSNASARMLSEFRADSRAPMDEALLEAVAAGFIVDRSGSYSFLHDRIQEASYEMIPEQDRAAVHLRIGRAFLVATPAALRESNVFDIAHQFNRGAALISAPEERLDVARLNLAAGKRAKAATAYDSALGYFTCAAALLPNDGWTSCYALAFDIELARAECEGLSGEHAVAEERLSALAGRARTVVDLAGVVLAQINFYAAADRADDAFAVCLAYLRRVGVDWSAKPTDDDVRREGARMLEQLGGTTTESLLDWPPMTDPQHRATMDILAAFASPCYFVDRNLYALAVLHMARLSIGHGNSDASAVAYVNLGGLVLGPRLGQVERGFEFGQLGLALSEKGGLDGTRARAYTAFAGQVAPWIQPLKAEYILTRRAHTLSLEAGDLAYASFSRMLVVIGRLGCGDPLGEVLLEAEEARNFASAGGFLLVVEHTVALMGLIRSLRGLTRRFGSFDDAGVDEQTFERELARRSPTYLVSVWYWVRKLQARFHAGAYREAVEAADRASDTIRLTAQSFEEADFHLYSALSHAALCTADDVASRSLSWMAVREASARLASWAVRCPANFSCRASIVAAEIARLEVRELDAERLYEEAIRLAREHGFLQIEALSNELAAGFYLARSFETIAHAYLRSACEAYLRWGALGKVQQMQELYPSLRTSDRADVATLTLGALAQPIDISTLVRTSQALSGEIILEKLLETLLRAAIEQAGAQRGVLMTCGDKELRVEADARTSADGIAVTIRQLPIVAAELPQTILHLVSRLRESVLLDDAAAPNPFSDDPYLQRTRCRSILCLPLMKQTKLVGVLYLENRLAPRVFTSARTSLLAMLASQAAISLENAHLYAEVHQASDRLKRIVDTIPTLAWSANVDGMAEFFNRRWLDYTGLTTEEARVHGWQPAIHADDSPLLEATWQRLLASGQPGDVEVRMQRADGEYRWFLFRAEPLRDEHGKILEWYGTSTDIEDRKRAEMELDSRLHFWTLRSEISATFASAPASMLGNPIRAAVRRVGELFEVDCVLIFPLTGNGPDLVASHHWAREGAAIPPLTVPVALFEDSIAALRRGEVVRAQRVSELPEEKHSERDFHRGNGFVAAVGLPMIVGGETIASMNFLSVREVDWSDDLVQRMHLMSEIFANALGRQRAAVELERSALALDHAKTELAHATRVTTLGELAASIAHEINQPLAAIVANARAGMNWLAREEPDLASVQGALEAMSADGDRAGQVLTRIRALLSRSPTVMAPCDLSVVIQGVVPLVRVQLLRDGLVLATEVGPDLPPVVGDPVQLQQVVLNLVLNAAEASRGVQRDRRDIVVRASVERRHGGASVVVAVEDAGTGFSESQLPRLFETFYTTKPTGLGMGLSISRSVIERHEGQLWAEANARHGATFSFAIPAIS